MYKFESIPWKCYFCGKLATHSKHIGCPSTVIVPNEYLLCDDCKDKTIGYDDIYDEQGNRRTRK